MQRDNIKRILISTGVILAVILLAGYILFSQQEDIQITEELAKCIGQNSVLYSQTGCIHCETQKALFGNYFGNINEIDCLKKENLNSCVENKIEGTPTWIINNQKYSGVRKISELKELTGC